MLFNSVAAVLAAAALAPGVQAAFDLNGKNNLVMYWGQSSAGSEQSLGDYCAETAGDVYVLSFVNSFGSGTPDGVPSLNIGGCGTTFDGSTVLHCPSIGADIKSCQSAGKKILLSLGGAVGSYGFTSDSQAQSTAEDLWNMFGGGSSDTRPFDDAVVDGFDLDIENNDPTGYPALVSSLRGFFNGASKDYYISTAPQCPFPDANVGSVLAGSDIDFAFIQFYNNPCAIGANFNWDTWQNFASNTSPNKNIKLFLGLPGSTSAAGSGYNDPSTIAQTVSSISSSANFGGIMLWDASQGFTNQVNGISFAQSMQNILDSDGGSDSAPAPASSAPAPAPASSAPATSAPAVQSVGSGAFSSQANLGLAASIPTSSAQETAAAATSAPPPPPEPTSTTQATVEVTSTVVLTTITTTAQETSTSVPPPVTTSAPPPALSATPVVKVVTDAPTPTGTCTMGETTCSGSNYAVCNFGTWVIFDCPDGTVCGFAGGYANCGFPAAKRDDLARRHHVHHAH